MALNIIVGKFPDFQRMCEHVQIWEGGSVVEFARIWVKIRQIFIDVKYLGEHDSVITAVFVCFPAVIRWVCVGIFVWS